jgi:membrane protein required for colicin V production
MNWLDIVLIILIIIPAFIGLRKGLIRMIFSLAGLVIGIIIAGIYYEPVSKLLTFTDNESLANIIAFILILAVVVIIAMILGHLFKKLADTITLGWLDHLLGAIVGFISGFLVLSAIMAIIVKFFESDVIAGSFMTRVMLDYFPVVMGLLPDNFQAVRDFFQS